MSFEEIRGIILEAARENLAQGNRVYNPVIDQDTPTNRTNALASPLFSTQSSEIRSGIASLRNRVKRIAQSPISFKRHRRNSKSHKSDPTARLQALEDRKDELRDMVTQLQDQVDSLKARIRARFSLEPSL